MKKFPLSALLSIITATKRKVSKNNVKYPYIKNKVTTIDIIYEYYVYGHNSQVVK